MTHGRLEPAGENRRELGSLRRRDRVSHEIHAAVNRVEAKLPHPIRNRARADAEFEQLAPRDHAELPTRQLRDEPVGAPPGAINSPIRATAGPPVDLCTHRAH
jgi:hypothetical protein